MVANRSSYKFDNINLIVVICFSHRYGVGCALKHDRLLILAFAKCELTSISHTHGQFVVSVRYGHTNGTVTNDGISPLKELTRHEFK